MDNGEDHKNFSEKIRKWRSIMTAKNSARLFASLLAEQHFKYLAADIATGYSYLAFLRKQAKHGDAYCPYARAIKLIGAQ